MKKLYVLFILLATCAYAVNAQVYFEEGFNSMPPTGWTIDDHAGNWSSESSANAGGTPSEAMFNWSPQFNGESHLACPPTDLTGVTTVGFSFKHMVDHYGGPYTVGVATRSGGGAWTTVWEVVDPSASINAEGVDLLISNADVGQADFEICFFYNGDSYNINYWYLDDAKLYVPMEHDVATKSILGDTYFAMEDVYAASAIVKNAGLNEETFDVTLEIYDGETNDLLFTETLTVTALASGAESTVNFTGYTLPFENALYDVVVFTALTGDMDPDNDMLNKFIYTYTSEREMVLLEIGTGTWCVFCPGAAMAADDFIANGQSVAVMEHHSGDDYENVASGARVDYYGITGFPTGVFDGVISYVGGNATSSIYTSYLPIYEERKEIKTAFSCDIFGGNTGGTDYEVMATVDVLGPAMNANVVLHIGLTESEIPETWFVLDHINFVTRLMLPDHNGTAVDIINNTHIEINETFTLDPTWDVAHCELVYFLQDTDTKEILQGGKVMVNDLVPVGIDETLEENGIAIHNIYPNPFTNTTNINFSLDNSENVIVSINDMTGREVEILLDSEMTAGDHQLTWEVSSDMPNGIYFCTIRTSEGSLTQKVMLSK